MGLSNDLDQGQQLHSTLRLHIHTQEEKKRGCLFPMRGSHGPDTEGFNDPRERPPDPLTP